MMRRENEGMAVKEENGQIVFADDQLELTFDRASGRWLALEDLASGDRLMDQGAQQAPLVITVNGVTTCTRERAHWWSVIDAETYGAKAQCTGYDCGEENGQPTLVLHTQEGDWLIDQRYTLVPGAARVERSLRIEYRGEGTALLRGVEFRAPWIDLGPVRDCYVEVPCYATKAHQPLAAVSLCDYWGHIHDKSDIGGGPGWKPALACVDNPGRNLALSVWSYSETEPSILRMRRGDHGTQAVHTVMLCDRFTPGHAAEWKGQYVQVHHGTWEGALESFQGWYDEVGLQAAEVPDWARTARIYELFIGDSERRATKFPDLDTLIDDLPRIQGLGFDTVEVMPHMDFPSYSVYDYYDADTHYGSAEGLKRLTARAHEMGMRVLLDVVLHGVMDREAVRAMRASQGHGWQDETRLPERHPYRVEHPEWFVQTEFGTPAATYTWSFDLASPGWQDFMVEVFGHYVTEYDVDGFRVDALTWNYFPNWAEGLPHRASATLYASEVLMERVRAAIQAIKPEAVLYTETTGPLFTRSCDLGYNYDMQWLFSGLVTPISPRGFAYSFSFPTERIQASDLGTWLQQRRLARPKGAITVHHLDSHDTNEWGGLMQYRREAFGEQAARALFAFCCALDGGVMVYQGAEDGAEDYYRKLLHLMCDLPALYRGRCDYVSVQVDSPQVYAPLRAFEGQVVVPAIHLADGTIHAVLKLPAQDLPAAGAYHVIDRMDDSSIAGPRGDAWTAEQLTQLRVEMGPWQVRMLEIVPV